MTKKRKSTALQEASRRRTSEHRCIHGGPQIDPTYGQRGAFPLDDPAEDAADDDLFVEAMTYLRGVRSQAQAIPHVLVAPQDTTDGAGVTENSRGYYEDGAYIASYRNPSQDEVDTVKSTDTTQVNAQDVYHASLISRFIALRAQLAGRPPNVVLDALDVAAQPTTFFGDAADKTRWQLLMITTDPLPAQLAAMTQVSVLGLLQIATWALRRKRLLARGEESRRIGAWIWGLLGRVGEVGTLGSMEVATVREMGKRAATVTAGLADLDEEITESGIGIVQDSEGGDVNGYGGHASRATENAPRITEGDITQVEKADLRRALSASTSGNRQWQSAGNTAGEGALAEARAHLFANHIRSKDQDNMSDAGDTSVEPNSHDWRLEERSHEIKAISMQSTDYTALATLDAILTIVGECYGQRDLLASRDKLWELEF